MVSSKPSIYDEALDQLRGSPAGFRCTELEALLDGLGFKVKPGKKGGHRVFTHSALAPGFRGSDFNCGHRSTEFVLRVYVRKIIRICEMYEDELRAFLK